MSEFKRISDRIKIRETESGTDIEITQSIEKKKMLLLWLWLVSWLFCGVVFIYSLMQQDEFGQKIYFGVLVGGWAFIFYRILRVTIWRLIGKEVFEIRSNVFSLQNAFGSLGKRMKFNLPHFKALKVSRDNKMGFFQFMENSFWVIGNNKFEFKYMGKSYEFGKQLNENEIKSMKRILDKAVRNASKVKH